MWHVDDFVFVAGETPMSSVRFVVYISAIHLLMTWALETLMSRRVHPVNVRLIQRYNNLLIGAYSFVTLVFINVAAYRDGRFVSWDRLVCRRPSPKGAYALIWYVFYLSKLWEFLDVYLVILNKSPVHTHFRWHHQTTPSVVLAGLVGDVSYEWPTIVSNSLLHTFMYPHFARLWNVQSTLVTLGACQLMVGLGFSIYGIASGCSGSIYAQVWGLLMYGTYTWGYLNEHFHVVNRAGLCSDSDLRQKEAHTLIPNNSHAD